MKIRLARTVEKIITQSVRTTESENKLYKRAAKRKDMAFNTWAVLALNAAAAQDLKPQPKETHGTSTE
jgi:hypothetical protein